MKSYLNPIILIPVLLTLFAGPGWAQDGDESYFTQPELDQMLAPVALYPDVLLSQVLMAATYPLEIVEASRWSQANPGLEGDEAVQAVEGKNWDESVKSLVAFPELIQLMDENLTWTRRLGDAFLIQEEQVMETVQSLRSKALENGSLADFDRIRIEREADEIIIEPREVEVVYVPYYSTRIVYGDWWWPDYPPIYWDVRPVYRSSFGISWSRGFRVSTFFYFSSCDWSRRSIVIHPHYRYMDRFDFRPIRSRPRYYRDVPVWHHRPEHRKGVHYRSDELNRRYDRKRYANTPPQRTHDERIRDFRDRTRRPDLVDRVPGREDRLKRPDQRKNPRQDDRIQRNPVRERPQVRPKPPELARKPAPRETPRVERKPPPAPPPPPDTARPTSSTSRDVRSTNDAHRRFTQPRERGLRAPPPKRDP